MSDNFTTDDLNETSDEQKDKNPQEESAKKESAEEESPEEASLVMLFGVPFHVTVRSGVKKYKSVITIDKEFSDHDSAMEYAKSLSKASGQEASDIEDKDGTDQSDGKDLLQMIASFIKKYVYLEREEEYFLVSVYSVLTYCFEMFNRIPYLNITGEQGTGKTTLMHVMGLLVAKPQFFSNTTDASIIRVVNEQKPTLFLDEVENLGSHVSTNLQTFQIINSGYEKNGKAVRTIKGDTVEFSTYCPKILGAIARLIPTIEDRCHILNMHSAKGAQIKPFLNTAADQAETTKIKAFIYSWLKENGKAVYEHSTLQSGIYINPLIKNRDLDKWFPLLVLSQILSSPGNDYLAMLNNYAREIIMKKSEAQATKPENVCKCVIIDFIKSNKTDVNKVPKMDSNFYYVLAEEFTVEVTEKDKVNSYTHQADVTKALKRAGIQSSRQRFAPNFPDAVIVYRVPVDLVA